MTTIVPRPAHVRMLALLFLVAAAAMGCQGTGTSTADINDVVGRHFDATYWNAKVSKEHRGERAQLVHTGPDGETVMAEVDLGGAERLEVALQVNEQGLRGSLAALRDDSTLWASSATWIPVALSGKRISHHRTWADGRTLLTTYPSSTGPATGEASESLSQSVTVRFVPVPGWARGP